MCSEAWLYQRPEQVQRMGADKAPHYVGWYDLDGHRRSKSFGPGFKGQKAAERARSKIENELMAGTHELEVKKLWADFRAEYERRILPGLAIRSRPEMRTSLDHFERIVKPVRVFAISTQHIDDFTAARRQEPGKKRGSLVSPATVNKDLRHLQAVLNVALEWRYLPRLPHFRFEKEPKKLATFVSGDHFTALYEVCDQAVKPAGFAFSPGDWWRALIVVAGMTGWRISEILALRREDLDLDAGLAITRAEDNKGDRDDVAELHPVAVEHLKRLAGFTPAVFPWPLHRRTLDTEYHRLQELAGIHLDCRERHEHTPACHVYGFHDLRRMFATLNADRFSADALQKLMRHRSYQTTQLYLNMSPQMEGAAKKLHVPEVLRKAERPEGQQGTG